MSRNYTGIEEGDRVLVDCETGQYWGSIIATSDPTKSSSPYQVRYDEFPEETRWIGNKDIARLHRGAGPSGSEER